MQLSNCFTSKLQTDCIGPLTSLNHQLSSGVSDVLKPNSPIILNGSTSLGAASTVHPQPPRLGVGGAMLDVVDAQRRPFPRQRRSVRNAVCAEGGHCCQGSKEADAVGGIGEEAIRHPPHKWMREREGEDQHAVERFYPRDLRCLAAVKVALSASVQCRLATSNQTLV